MTDVSALIPTISVTCDTIDIPSSFNKAFATAPTATRTVVSRAEERSKTFRKSRCPYFMPPTKSAWPGRGREI